MDSPLTTKRKKALVACLPDPSGNPRPYRAIKLLYHIGFDVYSLSQKTKNNINELTDTYEIVKSDILFFRKAIRWLSIFIVRIAVALRLNFNFFNVYSFAYGINTHRQELLNKEFDLILVEDLTLLPFCLTLRKNKNKIIFDAREYYPRENEGSMLFRYFSAPEKKILCKKFIPLVDRFYTVSRGLADRYEKEFACNADVIRSTPFYFDIKPKISYSFPIKLVHHGIANRDRCLENMIYVINNLEGQYCLDFYLTGNEKYIQELKKIASICPYVNFNKPVPFTEINNMLSCYDLGFYLLKPTGFNTMFNLPNKFFEFIQARIGMVIGPSPEMAQVANQYGVALISDDYTVESMVKLLRNVTLEQINQVKINSDIAAKELSWETESERLKRIILNEDV